MSAGPDAARRRIVDALDHLLDREAALAEAGSGSGIIALRARISPLMAHLAQAAGQAPDPALQAALDRLIAKRRANIALMQSALGRLRRGIEERAAALRLTSRTRATYRPLRWRPALLRGAA
jgi:hypothetical protein